MSINNRLKDTLSLWTNSFALILRYHLLRILSHVRIYLTANRTNNPLLLKAAHAIHCTAVLLVSCKKTSHGIRIVLCFHCHDPTDSVCVWLFTKTGDSRCIASN